MATLISPIIQIPGFVLHMPDRLSMSDDDFFDFCGANPELRIERTAEGDILIMAPVGSETGDSHSEIDYQLRHWAKRVKIGRVFANDTGFTLPNGAMRAPRNIGGLDIENTLEQDSQGRQKTIRAYLS